jgi:hypothetical protein
MGSIVAVPTIWRCIWLAPNIDFAPAVTRLTCLKAMSIIARMWMNSYLESAISFTVSAEFIEHRVTESSRCACIGAMSALAVGFLPLRAVFVLILGL